MRDKIKRYLPWGLTICAAAFGVAAFFLIFANAVKYDVAALGEDSFRGYFTALGYTKGGIELLLPSAGLIIAYLFPLLGACTAVIGKDSLIARLIASALLITGGALLLSAAHLVECTFGGTASLSVGTILGGIFALLGGAAEGAYCVINVLGKRSA